VQPLDRNRTYNCNRLLEKRLWVKRKAASPGTLQNTASSKPLAFSLLLLNTSARRHKLPCLCLCVHKSATAALRAVLTSAHSRLRRSWPHLIPNRLSHPETYRKHQLSPHTPRSAGDPEGFATVDTTQNTTQTDAVGAPRRLIECGCRMYPGAFAFFLLVEAVAERHGSAPRVGAGARAKRRTQNAIMRIQGTRASRICVGTMLGSSMFQMRNVLYGDVLMITRSVTEYGLSCRSPRSVIDTPPHRLCP
jgi:hypothetical protein